MSDDQKDAVVGRVMREHKENEEQIGKLFSEAAKLGNKLNQVGQALVTHPEGVCPDGSELDIRYTQLRVSFSASDFDVAKLTALTNDYRAALQERERLERQLTQLGFPVSRQSEQRGYRH